MYKAVTVIFTTILLIGAQSKADEGNIDADSTWDDVHMLCPNQCVCQHALLMDLSIARWMQEMRREAFDDSITTTTTNGEKITSNEAFVENDTSYLRNGHVKFIMCVLQADGYTKDFISSLPQDVQALVLLHNGNSNTNLTVFASDLLQLADLETVEIRGTDTNRNLIFHIDEPMPLLKHVNFEAVMLYADEKIAQEQPKGQHPSETFDYIPESQRDLYHSQNSSNQTVQFVQDVEIVPYNVYVESQKPKRATFVGWTSLEVLRIHNSNFNEIHWEMFDGLTNLQHISLEHNEIQTIPPFAFYGAPHTRTLSLAQNAIVEMHYFALAGLLELEHLDLTSNKLFALSELTFPPFPKLQTADLRDNPIESIAPMTFGIMNATVELILGSSQVAFDLAASNGAFLALDQLKELTLLNVSSGGSLSQKMFVGLKQLQRLTMHGEIGRVEYDAFAEMPNIKELVLSHCAIVDISMDAFFGSKQLRFVDLSFNRLTQIPANLFEQNELEEIYLQHNQLQKLPGDFFGMSTLKLVRLVENPWICSCTMNKWKQSLTNSIRTMKLATAVDEHCIRNGKTGKIEYCADGFDDFPRYAYGYDNSLSPLCQYDNQPARDVFYSLRHTIKCATGAKPLSEKQRFKNKLQMTLEKMARTNHKRSNEKKYSKTRRGSSIGQKIVRTHSANAKILTEQTFSNDILY